MLNVMSNYLNAVFDCCQVAGPGLEAIVNISGNAGNQIALRPHIGLIVSLLQEHSSKSEVYLRACFIRPYT